MQIDAFDKEILDIVQGDNQLSHSEIGQRVNLSASSVRRRLIRLRQSGVILGNVSLTDPNRYGSTFIVNVWFGAGGKENDQVFREQMIADPCVSQCYSVSGEFDYVLVVHSKTPEEQEKWAEHALMANPAIHRYSTCLVWSRTKFSTKIPFTEGPKN